MLLLGIFVVQSPYREERVVMLIITARECSSTVHLPQAPHALEISVSVEICRKVGCDFIYRLSPDTAVVVDIDLRLVLKQRVR